MEKSEEAGWADKRHFIATFLFVPLLPVVNSLPHPPFVNWFHVEEKSADADNAICRSEWIPRCEVETCISSHFVTLADDKE